MQAAPRDPSDSTRAESVPSIAVTGVSVFDCSEADAARRSSERGDTIVITGTDATAVGALVASLQASGGRVAAFVGDPATERDALDEMLAELFA